ncbi:hypothetical protein F4780DRAFT_774949 [Xylariomycetidae sp. FL0641]|nr:hypothetical protein F4780DRAFT_774949 [Xylariomycetidae sp. FL0641]
MAAYETGNSFGELLKTVGSWGRPSGRGLYMFRSMIVASSTAALLGLATAVGGGLLVSSGSFGFLVGSCVGFVGASIHYYNMSLTQSLLALDEHPRLMRLHLAYNFPWLGFQHLPLPQLQQQRAAPWWRGSWVRQGHLIAAWHSAGGALDEIHDRRARALVEAAVAGDDEGFGGGRGEDKATSAGEEDSV